MTKEQLEALGLNEDQIKEIFKLNGLAIEEAKNKNTTLSQENENLKTQLTQANNQIEKFKEIDVEAIKTEAENYKTKFEQSEADNAKKLAELELDFEIDRAIITSGARNAKAIKALLDTSVLKESKNLKEDMEAQINGLKESDSYLFATSEEETVRIVTPSGGGGNTEMTKDDFNKLGFGERVELKRKNETLYNKLVKGD